MRERLEVDAVVVGAGPAGLAAAWRLRQLARSEGRDVSVLILEKAAEPGDQVLSGAVIDPASLERLAGDDRSWADLLRPVAGEAVYWLEEAAARKLPWVPRPLQNRGFWVGSLGKLVRWLAERVEAAGGEIACSCPAVELVWEGSRVAGVLVKDFGRDRSGRPRPNFTPGPEVRAHVTLLAEGVRGTLSEAAVRRCELRRGKSPPRYAVGVKELWESPGAMPGGEVWHTVGYPQEEGESGGGFCYSLGRNVLSLGLVAEILPNRRPPDPHRLLQAWKRHPLIQERLKGGRRLAYGARALPEGGWEAAPRLFADGLLLLGDAAGLLDAARLKGIHLAVASGMAAAEAAWEALSAGDTSAARLARYEEVLAAAPEFDAFRRSRRLRERWASRLRLARRLWPVGGTDRTASAANDRMQESEPEEDRSASVAFASIAYEEEQPSPIRILRPDLCATECRERHGNPCRWFCPAGVFAVVGGDGPGIRVEVQPGNCLHCKTCEVADPFEAVRWEPPEGGQGPRWRDM
ncbi:MAG: electron transfer flavoprotein-ubiquinone oxidoreductase [Acidobacteriota bacterium]